ncbi:MAG TPA: IPT/TIG domain-containing protein [Solirubrobacteraceae bacterium]|nr:IPT/TIG domain-containing protein [Solirubrobacteraceae bacterium]
MSPLAAMDRAMAHTFATLSATRRVLPLLLVSLVAALAATAAFRLLATGSGAGGAGGASREAATATVATASIPAQARAEVSAALGAARTAFHVEGTGGTLHAGNPAQHLNTSFTRAGASISTGELNLSLSLSSVGFGEGALQRPLAQASPAGHLNRVSYDHGAGVSEWYANGPAGVEQGFTLARPPAGAASAPAGPLTLTLALKANATPRLADGGTGMTLTRGASRLHYGELLSTDANGRALRTWLQLQPGHLLIHVDANGAAYPLRIDPLTQVQPKLTASDELGEGLFGTSVALSADGSTLLVGGPQDANPARGAAWVFVRSGSQWAQQGSKLTGVEVPNEPPPAEEECAEESQEEAGECSFGNSVALSADGNTALIGEPSATTRHGNAWIFTRSGETWTRAAVLVGGAGAGGRFGKSVALSADGHTALVGDPSAAAQRGSAWVFTGGGGSWSEQAVLTQPAAAHFDHLGRAVALSGDGATALLGAPGAGGYKGGAWVFSRSSSVWSVFGGELTGSGEEGEGRFGKSLALSADGQTALVGATYDAGGRGAVWPFARTSSSFAAQGEKLQGPAEATRFGYSVALASDGSAALVGAPHAPEGGTVFQLTRSGSAWTQLPEQLEGSDGKGRGWTGAALALSGDGTVAAVGAPHDSARVGATWLFAGPSIVQPGAPVVKKVTPGFGPAGTVVRVRGTGFSGATAVSFGGTPATSFTVRSAIMIEATAPAGEGIVDVTVQTPVGTSAVSAEDTFRYTAGKGKPGGSENEDPEHKGKGAEPTPGGNPPGTTGTGSGTGQSASGGVLGSTSTVGAACQLTLRSKRLAVTGSRTVALRLQRAGTSACSGKLTLSFNKARRGKRPKLQTIGTASFAMGSATSKVLKIDLNKLGRKLFRNHGGKLNASLSFVRSVPAPRLARSASVRLTFKKTKKVKLGR